LEVRGDGLPRYARRDVKVARRNGVLCLVFKACVRIRAEHIKLETLENSAAFL